MVFSQATSTAQPTLDVSGSRIGLQSVKFDFQSGNNKYMSAGSTLNIPSTHTIFAVGYWTSSFSNYSSINLQNSTSTDCLQNGGCSSAILIRYNSNSGGGSPSSYSSEVISSSQYAYSTPIPVASGRFQNTIIGDGVAANYQFRGDGNLLSLAGSSMTAGLSVSTIGSTDNLYVSNGNLGEVLIYNRKLTPSEISTIETYLKSKWGTP